MPWVADRVGVKQNNPELQLDAGLRTDQQSNGMCMAGTVTTHSIPRGRYLPALHRQGPVPCPAPLLERHQSIPPALGSKTVQPGCKKAKGIRKRGVTCPHPLVLLPCETSVLRRHKNSNPKLELNPSISISFFHLNMNPLSNTRHHISSPGPGKVIS